MTLPNGETPGAPATAPAPTAPAPGAPAAPPANAPGPDPSAPIDFTTLPANVQSYIKGLRDEAGGHRTGKAAAERAAAQANDKYNAALKALGVNADGSANADPEAVAAQLSSRAEAAEVAAWSAGVKLQIHQLAGPLGANAAALLDSVTFLDVLDDLVDVDPNTAEFRTALEAKIREAMATSSALRGTSGPSRSGGEFTGGSGAGQPITEEQLAAMTPTEMTKAFNEGKLKHFM